ncbi:hypothetical protein Tsubulata_021750 [Turnera subulata]|uniref:SBP-type domain-containing protein n=1 Tax=Turnera subulata TaxID=218843 RepID=A0A9Q0FF48_9ROSI|nr:hypothetical protein Tsubulata_021750 [Turnera subulata]
MGHKFTTPWELTELPCSSIPRITHFAASSSLGVPEAQGHFSADLNLGNSGDFEDYPVDKIKDPGDSLMESSSLSSKRARTPGNVAQVPSCLVDGCTSDLSKCRDYHRRHKVCELHSKTPRVFIKGREQRFCQQCSRFHSLEEFDEGKRSCRKRLDGHNRRRRKPQPDSLSVNSAGLFTTHQGTRYLHFGSSSIFSTSNTSSAWSATVKVEDEPMLYSSQTSLSFGERKNTFHGSLSHSHKGGKGFPFSQGTTSQPPQSSPDVGNSIIRNSCASQKMYSEGPRQVLDSNRALSLLSSPPSQTREIGLHQMVQTGLNPSAPCLIPSLNYSVLGMGSDSAESGLVSDGSGTAKLHGQNVFQIGPDGSSATGTHQTLSFSWK